MRKAIDLLNWDNDDMLNCSPVLKCKLNGVEVTLLLDSGASISFLDKAFLLRTPALKPLLQKGKHAYHCNGFGASKSVNEIAIIETLTFASKRYVHEFKVTDLNLPKNNKGVLYHGIIGFDFLAMHKLTLNFKDFMILD